jgi:hypothetical protein
MIVLKTMIVLKMMRMRMTGTRDPIQTQPTLCSIDGGCGRCLSGHLPGRQAAARGERE